MRAGFLAALAAVATAGAGFFSPAFGLVAARAGRRRRAEVLPLAEEVDQPPRGQVLSTGTELAMEGLPADAPAAKLTIDDITTGES